MPEPEAPIPNLNEIIDIRFRAIEAELYVTLDYLQILDDHLPVVARNVRARLERELDGLEEEEFLITLRWIDEYVDQDLPRLYFLASSCSVMGGV